jgi:hypothetical protein
MACYIADKLHRLAGLRVSFQLCSSALGTCLQVFLHVIQLKALDFAVFSAQLEHTLRGPLPPCC